MTTAFYTKALQLFIDTQMNQIQKGLEKYPEPFNPHSWTPQELLNHALEETVDLTHYLVGLKDLLDAKDLQIKKLQLELQRYKQREAKEAFKKKPVRQFSPFESEMLHKYFDSDDQH